MSLQLSNKMGESVEVPISVAKELFTMFDEIDTFAANTEKPVRSHARPGEKNEVEKAAGEAASDGALRLGDLDYGGEVLEAVRGYAVLPPGERTAAIAKPLNTPLSGIIRESELRLLKGADEKGFIIELLDLAAHLGFRQLMELCAAYVSERIHEIALAGPNIMTAAEHARRFLKIEDEWTPEEMEMLRREMEHAKQVDPSVY